MLNSLIRLLDDSNLNYLENRLSAGLDRFKKALGTSFSTIEDKEDHYELVLDVAADAKASNVTVDFDDDTRELSIEYKYEAKNYSNISSIVETLPFDADEDSIEATVDDGKLTILIQKKVVEYSAEEAPANVVKVNRKNRK